MFIPIRMAYEILRLMYKLEDRLRAFQRTSSHFVHEQQIKGKTSYYLESQ